jgi:23S rRNA (adenine2503-C2)-methyltransferase
MKTIKVPTGHIYIGSGEKGSLEWLCLRDYGKERNLKADFLGLTRPLNGVPGGDPMPLTEKAVITISTQYGCSMGCTFCDVPKVGPGINATIGDLHMQVDEAIRANPEVLNSKRTNIHYARMGEPTWNPAVLQHAIEARTKAPHVHPVVSTMMPRGNKKLEWFLKTWAWIKYAIYDGNAGLQLSINTTDEKVRRTAFGGSALTLPEISALVADLPCRGRKFTLNFALTEAKINARYLEELFPPSKFLCKITPMHLTASCVANEITTKDGYTTYAPYEPVEDDLKAAGFDVIVFVPSVEEDKSRITCGNAILSDLGK